MSDLSIKLEGYPEKVQRIADVLEKSFPGMLIWVLSEDTTDGIRIAIEGFELPTQAKQAPPLPNMY